MPFKVKPRQWIGAGVAVAAIAFGTYVGKATEEYSRQQIVSQVVHDNPAEIALAKSHYQTSTTVGRWAFYGGGTWIFLVSIASLLMFAPDKLIPDTAEDKRKLAARLISQAEEQELAKTIEISVKEVLNHDGE